MVLFGFAWKSGGGGIRKTVRCAVHAAELGVRQNGARCYTIDVEGMDRREQQEKTKCDNTYDRESQSTGRRSTWTRRYRTAALAEHCSMIAKDRWACPKMTATRARLANSRTAPTLLARTVMVLSKCARGSIRDTLKVRSKFGGDTLELRWRFGRGMLNVRSTFCGGLLEVGSRFGVSSL